MAMIGMVWTDGAPAIGMEYGPGDTAVCCPVCDRCLVLIVEAQRGDTTLGWMLFDDDGKCGHMLDASQYVMEVTGEPGAITVVFSTTAKIEETKHAEAEASGADDVRPKGRRVRKAEPSGRSSSHSRPKATPDQEGKGS